MALGVIMLSSWDAGGSEEEDWMGRGMILWSVLKVREV